jgi:hypothetical protein
VGRPGDVLKRDEAVHIRSSASFYSTAECLELIFLITFFLGTIQASDQWACRIMSPVVAKGRTPPHSAAIESSPCLPHLLLLGAISIVVMPASGFHLHLFLFVTPLTMVAHAGLVLLAVVVVAAGAAAYENPQVREWIENSRKKLAQAIHSLGEEIDPRVKNSRRKDPSMQQDDTEAAEERRRRARAEIMEKGRIMEEKRSRKTKKSGDNGVDSPTASFDTLVDGEGMLQNRNLNKDADATTTAMESAPAANSLTARRTASPPAARALHESVDAPIALRQLSSASESHPIDPFETDYERELRNTWHLPLPHPPPPASSAHESESLVELTPTSEFPDPDIVLPGHSANNGNHHEQSQYFSFASNSSHTLSEDNPASPPTGLSVLSPLQPPAQPQPQPQPQQQPLPHPISPPSVSSIADSLDHIGGSDVDGGSISDDGVMSEFDDGVRTPASGWTDVGSVVSSDVGE